MEQLTLWRVPTLVERAVAVLAAARSERRDLTRRGPRRTNAGAPRTVDRIARIRRMDDALIRDAGDGYLGTAEVRLTRAVMYELNPKLSLSDADRDYGWPEGTSAALKHRYPERWRQERNRLIDSGVDRFQTARLSLLERMLAGCENATRILEAAMAGATIDGMPVTKDMQIAAREWLKTARDLGRDLSDFTPAADPEVEADEQSEAMESHAERLVAGAPPAGETN
jgi:hypothetical protein